MASKPITVSEFPGMNNVSRQGITGQTSDGKPVQAATRIVLNMNVTTDKKLEKRAGYALWQPLPGAHSIFFTGDEFLCAAKGSSSLESLYRISLSNEIQEICPIAGQGNPLFYILLAGSLYISSLSWSGIYEDGTVRAWGRDYGDDPTLLDGAGSSEEQILLTTIAAPLMANLCLAGGRIFGSISNRVYFNDPPLGYELYRPDAFFDFPHEITMIALAEKAGKFGKEGFYVASETATWFAAGFDPEQWDIALVGDGAIPGTLQYIPHLGEADNVPVWLNRLGLKAGVNGVIQKLSQDKVRFNVGKGNAASFYRQQEGGQYLSSFVQPPDVGFGDSATCEVVRAGKLIT